MDPAVDANRTILLGMLTGIAASAGGAEHRQDAREAELMADKPLGRLREADPLAPPATLRIRPGPSAGDRQKMKGEEGQAEPLQGFRNDTLASAWANTNAWAPSSRWEMRGAREAPTRRPHWPPASR